MNEQKQSNPGADGPDLIRGLLDTRAFPHPAGRRQLIETHISWVVLAGDYAYKIKKPVDFGFVNFSTPDLRRHFCAEEVRLNQRFAPSIYLGVVPIGGSVAQPRVGREPALEWAVHMVRFPADAALDLQVAENRVPGSALTAFGEALAKIHARAACSPDPTHGAVDSIREPVFDNFASLGHTCADIPGFGARLRSLREWTEHTTTALEPVFETRVGQQRIRECHGDLHLGNIVRPDDTCIAFDCLEFDPALRWIDVISDVGFLVMDLLRHDRADLACRFLNRYLEVSGDYPGLAALPYYAVYRALVRAKTTALQIAQQGPAGDFARVLTFMDLASRIAKPTSNSLLVICHGLSGSGKTWVSDQLIPELPAIRIRSDTLRKRLHGLAELDRSDTALHEGIYAADATRRTYDRAAEFAALGLRAGLNVIVDAACLRSDARRRFERIADAAGATAVILHCTADHDILEARVRERSARGADASEAGSAVLRDQLRREEPLTAAELARSVIADTGRDLDCREIAVALRAHKQG
ncbi:MAG: AAA family ATPase [Gammaproteobacteria bacterium]